MCQQLSRTGESSGSDCGGKGGNGFSRFRHGFGAFYLRYQDSHKELEQKLAAFTGMEDAILYSSCFDANGGLFETLLSAEDAIISDALNHASIIDGVRLCKAKRYRYANNDMQELEARLKEAREAVRVMC